MAEEIEGPAEVASGAASKPAEARPAQAPAERVEQLRAELAAAEEAAQAKKQAAINASTAASMAERECERIAGQLANAEEAANQAAKAINRKSGMGFFAWSAVVLAVVAVLAIAASVLTPQGNQVANSAINGVNSLAAEQEIGVNIPAVPVLYDVTGSTAEGAPAATTATDPAPAEAAQGAAASQSE